MIFSPGTKGDADFKGAIFLLLKRGICLTPIVEVSYKVEAVMPSCLIGTNHEGNSAEARVPAILLLYHTDPPVKQPVARRGWIIQTV